MESSTRNQGMTKEEIRIDFEEWAKEYHMFSLDRDGDGNYIDYLAGWWFNRWVDNKGMPK